MSGIVFSLSYAILCVNGLILLIHALYTLVSLHQLELRVSAILTFVLFRTFKCYFHILN